MAVITATAIDCIDDLVFHAQYDWTTGVLDNGNERRKFRAVPRLYPLRSLVCTLFNKGGSRGAFRPRGASGDHFHCTVEPSPGRIRCRCLHTLIFFLCFLAMESHQKAGSSSLPNPQSRWKRGGKPSRKQGMPNCLKKHGKNERAKENA